MTPIYKILRLPEWEQLARDGTSAGAPIDVADGFIHFSGADTLQGTLDRWFTDRAPLVIAELDADALGPELKWEPSRDGQLFPHLYAPLQHAHIIRHWRVEPNAAGRYEPGL